MGVLSNRWVWAIGSSRSTGDLHPKGDVHYAPFGRGCRGLGEAGDPHPKGAKPASPVARRVPPDCWPGAPTPHGHDARCASCVQHKVTNTNMTTSTTARTFKRHQHRHRKQTHIRACTTTERHTQARVRDSTTTHSDAHPWWLHQAAIPARPELWSLFVPRCARGMTQRARPGSPPGCVLLGHCSSAMGVGGAWDGSPCRRPHRRLPGRLPHPVTLWDGSL